MGRVHGFVGALGLFALALGPGVRTSEACDRPRVHPIDLVFAAADVVLEGRVEGQGDGRGVKVRVTRAYKGAEEGSALELLGVQLFDALTSRHCQGTPTKPKERYLFSLFLLPDGRLIAVDPDDGVLALDDARLDARVRQSLEALPRIAWRSHPSGLRAKLVAPREGFGSEEEVDLVVWMQNVAEKPLTIAYRTWPRDRHTFCELRGRSRSGALRAEGVPISDPDIDAYFSKHGPSYDRELAPFETHTLRLMRIGSAKPGWGYKEELGFRYYPLPKGSYELSASCRGFFPGAIETEPIRLVIR